MSSVTGSVGVGVFAAAMASKPDAPGVWLWIAIAGAAGAAGSVFSLVALLRQKALDDKKNAAQQEQNNQNPPPPKP